MGGGHDGGPRGSAIGSGGGGVPLGGASIVGAAAYVSATIGLGGWQQCRHLET